jgi:hypothetical protein
MGEAKVFVVFYLSEEINIKDIDREIYTDDKKIFHLFFFHNINLDTDKQVIFKRVVVKEFENIDAVMTYSEKEKTLTMIKKMENFSFKDIDEKIDSAYKKHLDIINYRISCILDTFTLFGKLYKDKPVIFLMPDQVSEKFLDLLETNKTKHQNIENIEAEIKYYDIIHWADYFSKVFSETEKKIKITEKNITKMLEIIYGDS